MTYVKFLIICDFLEKSEEAFRWRPLNLPVSDQYQTSHLKMSK